LLVLAAEVLQPAATPKGPEWAEVLSWAVVHLVAQGKAMSDSMEAAEDNTAEAEAVR
jgi:hypothetical protein